MINKTYSSSPKPQFDSFVLEVQKKLNCVRRSFHGNWEYLDEDGKYGVKTQNAVKSFQIYRGITPVSGILGSTTYNYLNELYNKIPQITSANNHLPNKETPRSIQDNISTGLNISSFFVNDGLLLHKELEKLFPIAFQRVSRKCEAPFFVFSKTDAYHNTFGAKYKRINIPDNISKYLGTINTIWSWIIIKNKIDEYKTKIQNNEFTPLTCASFANEIFQLTTASADTLVTWFPKLSRFGYVAAETGGTITLAGGAALSTIGQCIGAFLLGCEIGKLIGIIPVGDGKNVQDCVDEYIDKAWEHPYKTLGITPIAIVLDSWKRIIDFNVNRVSNLKPLTPEEKKQLEKIIRENKELYIQAAPPLL